MKTKRILMIAALLFTTSVINFSCKSDDDGGDGGNAASGTITAKIDGAAYKTIEMTTTAANENGVLIVMGNDGKQSPNKAVTLQIINFDGVGTYPIGGGGNIMNIASYIEVDASNPTNVKTWQAPYDSSQVGEIKISEITNTYVKGTFSYKAKSSTDGSIKNITEGSFNVKISSAQP